LHLFFDPRLRGRCLPNNLIVINQRSDEANPKKVSAVGIAVIRLALPTLLPGAAAWKPFVLR
jgi:hypothetical protein